SFWTRTQADLGIRTDHVLTFSLPVSEGRFSSPAQIDGFYRQFLERFQIIPGVLKASLSAPNVPLDGTGFFRQVAIAGSPTDVRSTQPSASVQMVTPEYFDTFHIRISQGRALTEQDVATGPRVAVVNERFAKRYLEGRDPLRQRISMSQFLPGTASV